MWVGSSREDLSAFPGPARREAGYALYLAQMGTRAIKANPLKGFGGAGVLEIVADCAGNAYRAVYTVRFPRAVYVLHAFQKKSKKGISTAKSEMDLVRRRLRIATAEYKRAYGSKGHEAESSP
ncbi:MAG TPA: type II toxin-antitoxin system RelE/ParE family toxin [Phycisphaerae bacterium]